MNSFFLKPSATCSGQNIRKLKGLWNVRLPSLWNDKVFTPPEVIKHLTQSSKLQTRLPTVLHLQEGLYRWWDRFWRDRFSTSSCDKIMVLGRNVLPKCLWILPGCMCQVSKIKGWRTRVVFLFVLGYQWLWVFNVLLYIFYIQKSRNSSIHIIAS